MDDDELLLMWVRIGAVGVWVTAIAVLLVVTGAVDVTVTVAP